MAARQNRVASVFFPVASHAAETPPPRPREALLTGSAAILAALWTLYLHRGSFAAIQILPKFHRSIEAVFGTIFSSRECGAMAQRGEIQCAESQFALQSGRREKPEKFRIGGTLQGKSAMRLPLFVFLFRQSQGLSRNTKRGFLMSSIRVWLLRGTRNEDRSDPLSVQHQKARAIGEFHYV